MTTSTTSTTSTNTVTALEKRVGYQLKNLTMGKDGGLVAQFAVGAIDESGAFKPMAEKSYVITAQDAEPILGAVVKSGTIRDHLINALVTNLSKRPDWIA